MKVLSLTLLLSCVSGLLQADTMRLAVASNFTATAHELISVFQQSTGHRVHISSGSTGKLYIQINQGAPFDFLLAADMERPQLLFDKGLASNAPFTYATGQLILWSRDLSEITSGLDALKNSAIKRLAIANPITAPYGKAAQQILDNITYDYAWTLVQGDNISQTYQFAATGNADAAFIAGAQYVLNNRGYAWTVPQALYSPIQQGALLLKKGDDNPAAHAFYRFLRSDQARSVIRNHGYTTE